jgi:ATP synthase protein I
MTDPQEKDSLKSLGDRLNEARLSRGEERNKIGPQTSVRRGLGFAMRLGVELVSALAIGVGIGYILDQWVDTTPLFLLIFFVLGGAAGVFNVFRMVSGLTQTIGYQDITRDKD